MAIEKLDIIVALKDTFSKGTKSITKSMGVMRGGVGKLKDSIFTLKSAVVGVIGLGIGFVIKDLIGLTNEQAKAVIGMETALRSMGQYSGELSGKLQDVASSIQGFTNYGDEAVLMGQKMLITYQNIGMDLMPRVTMAMADLAALMGGDMKSAANMLGKASMGLTGSLRIAGISVNKATYEAQGFVGVLAEIEAQSRGQAAAQRVATGAMVAMGNSFGDIKEKLGDFAKVLLEPGFNALLIWFDDINEKLAEFMKGERFGEWVDEMSAKVMDFLERMSLGTIKTYGVIAPVILKLKDLTFGLWSWFEGLPTWVQSAGLIAAILGGTKVRIATVALIELYNSTKRFGVLFNELKRKIVGGSESVKDLTTEIAFLEQELHFKKWTFMEQDEVDDKLKRLESLKVKLAELQDRAAKGEDVGEIINGESVSKEVAIANEAIGKFFDRVRNGSRESGESVEDWLKRAGEDFSRFGESASDSIESLSIVTDKTFEAFMKQAKKAYSVAKKEAESYAQKVIDIENTIRLLRMSTTDKIREIQRKSMTESVAYADERAQAEEKVAAARKALIEGDLPLARKFVQEAESLYAGLAREIKEKVGEKDVVTQSMETSVAIATAGVQEVGKLAVEIEKKQKSLYETMEEEAVDRMKTIQGEMDALTEMRQLDIEIRLVDLEDAKEKINTLIEDETKHITVEISKKKSEREVGMQEGGIFPGYGGGDKINVLAEAGEGFVNKEAIRKYGKSFFHAYNSLSLPISSITKMLKARLGGILSPDLGLYTKGFQMGGVVSSSTVKDMGRVELTIGSNAYPVMANVNVIEELKIALERENLVRAN